MTPHKRGLQKKCPKICCRIMFDDDWNKKLKNFFTLKVMPFMKQFPQMSSLGSNPRSSKEVIKNPKASN